MLRSIHEEIRVPWWISRRESAETFDAFGHHSTDESMQNYAAAGSLWEYHQLTLYKRLSKFRGWSIKLEIFFSTTYHVFVGNVLEMVRIPLKESKDQFLNNNRYLNRELIFVHLKIHGKRVIRKKILKKELQGKRYKKNLMNFVFLHRTKVFFQHC